MPEHQVQILDLRFESSFKLRKTLQQFKPQVVGISINNTIQVNQSRMILTYIKNEFPKIIRIVGEHHPTRMPEDFYWWKLTRFFG